MDAAESTLSIWKTEPVVDRARLADDQTCDVCVIGAGIAGLSTAYQLARKGVRVLVLEARSIGAGETGQTTAHLASALDDRFSELLSVHGDEATRLAYDSHARAIDEIENTCRREGIDCHFARLDGYLFLGPEHTPALLDEEFAAARRVGVDVERLPRAPLPTLPGGPCLRFPNQGRFHPLRYLAGLAAAIERLGGTIACGTFVTHVSGGERPVVRTQDGHEVHASAVVIATNSPQAPRVSLHAKQAPYRTYVVTLRVQGPHVPDALYWDTSDPYHYVRLERGADGIDQLIVGGEDHRTGTEDDPSPRYRKLELWAREHFSGLGAVTYRWSGQVLEPGDYLAFIGKDPGGQRNVYVATGDSGHGMTHGTIAGLLLAELIRGNEHPWQKLYDPARKTARAAREYLRDGVEMAGAYALWLRPRETERRDILPGEGAVVRQGLHKLAVYRDPHGTLHERSAVCTHLGAPVQWNSDAKSWDCPAHGSRFSPTGEVLNGPAACPLRALSVSSAGDRPLGRSLMIGAAGGAVATLAMSAFMLAAQKSGVLGEMPPQKITRAARRALGVRGVRKETDAVLATAAHFAFGMGAGALFAALHRRRSGAIDSSLLGAAYGASVWAASYSGWVPALGIMARPARDRSLRPTAMVLAHLLFGGVLGNVVDRWSPSKPAARAGGASHLFPTI